MQRTFRSTDADEFRDLVASYPFTRRITEVHLHHTWRPRRGDYRGLATIEGMWRHHTRVNGWEDIAQHVTVAPDGAIWLCRNFNWTPASARGFNGNRKAGPFMIEMIGDFDTETMPDRQLEATLAVIASVQRQFELDAHAIRFHNEMSDKSCPGRAVDKRDWVARIEAHVSRAGGTRGGAPLFPHRSSRYWELMREMNPDAEQRDEMLDAEHEVGDGQHAGGRRSTPGGAPRETRDGARGLDDARLDELADHVVNLERGAFSSSGRVGTTPGDVDRLFAERLPSEVERARADGRKVQLLFYAHGGLVSEGNALLGAAKQLDFWRANGIYPVFFVWETGLAETVRQLVAEAVGRGGGSRGGPFDWLADNVTDKLIEELVRALGAKRVWSGMQSSAALASASGGGAAYVARRLRKFLRTHGDDVVVHTAGHSAGSIFHAHFMAELARREVPIGTAHYLAPAIANALFHEKVAPLLGNGVEHLTLYTMTRRRELADTVTSAYRKSLLYLVHAALERERDTPILGLEESLRADRRARKLFGLRGQASTTAEVIFSPSTDSGSGNASGATTHGGFDDDPATMQSIARRVLGRRDGQPISPFPAAGSRDIDGYWSDQFEWPPGLACIGAAEAGSVGAEAFGAGGPGGTGGAAWASAAGAAASNVPGGSSGAEGGGTGGDARPGGARRALCIGIDAYVRKPLGGCVADARTWKRTLERLDFGVELLIDQQATAERILARVRALVAAARPGDHLVLQFAGHGTRFTDLDGDEAGGDTPATDECLCAVDCDFDGDADGLVIDDELRLIIDTLVAGASLTCFFDCCHSGSASRAAVRRAARAAGSGTVRSRHLPPSEAMRVAYARRSARLARSRSSVPSVQRDVLFSACRSNELAYESDGQGEFTRRATRLIDAGVPSLDNSGFLERVLAAFGNAPRQTPELHCATNVRGGPFLGDLAATPSADAREDRVPSDVS